MNENFHIFKITSKPIIIPCLKCLKIIKNTVVFLQRTRWEPMSAAVTISAPGAFTTSARMSIWWALILVASHIGWLVQFCLKKQKILCLIYTIFVINLTHTVQIHKAVPYNRMALHFKQRGHHVSAGSLATPRVCLRGTTASSTALLLAPHRLCNSDAESTSAHVFF